MRSSINLIIFSILLFIQSISFPQQVSEKPTSLYLQFGASSGFASSFAKPILLPQAGLDISFGNFGFRLNGSYFKTSPEFDINGYLEPIKSVLTLNNFIEQHSNYLFSFSPYLNIGTGKLSIEPSVGVKYLMQKSATAEAITTQSPGTSILKYPESESNNNLFTIDPIIRISYGIDDDFLRLFLEAGYSIPISKNEVSYSLKSYTNITDPRGMIDVKALQNSKQVIKTEKTLPSMFSIGAGIQIMLFQSKPKNECEELEASGLKSYHTEKLKADYVLDVLSKGNTKGSKLERLYKYASFLGYIPSKNSSDHLGFSYTAIPCKEIQPPPGIKASPIKKVTSEIVIQSFIKEGTKNHAAIVCITLKGGDSTKIREMFIEVPDGNYSFVKENIIRNGKVSQTEIYDTTGNNGGLPVMRPPKGWRPRSWATPSGGNGGGGSGGGGGRGGGGGNSVEEPSWWEGYKQCLRDNCYDAFMSALIFCAPTAATFGGYFACIVEQVAACAIRCVACQLCECIWWCKGVCGCCK